MDPGNLRKMVCWEKKVSRKKVPRKKEEEPLFNRTAGGPTQRYEGGGVKFSTVKKVTRREMARRPI